MILQKKYKASAHLLISLIGIVISSPLNAYVIQNNRYFFTNQYSYLHHIKTKLRQESYTYDNKLRSDNLYNQTVGSDPAGWMLSGPALDTIAAGMQRPYYRALGTRNVPKNYIYYDWGW